MNAAAAALPTSDAACRLSHRSDEQATETSRSLAGAGCNLDSTEPHCTKARSAGFDDGSDAVSLHDAANRVLNNLVEPMNIVRVDVRGGLFAGFHDANPELLCDYHMSDGRVIRRTVPASLVGAWLVWMIEHRRPVSIVLTGAISDAE